MAYSKEAAQQNRQIAKRAKQILDGGTNENGALEILSDEFPGIASNRLRARVGAVIRKRYSREVRARASSKGWGGKRSNQPGRPPKAGPKREKHSPTLAPGTKELAQAIAQKQGFPGWGYAVDEGIKLLAEKLNLE